MKKLLLIAGIVIIVISILSLLFAALNLFGYYNALDGSSELYSRLHRRAVVFFVLGTALAAVGAACLIIRVKI